MAYISKELKFDNDEEILKENLDNIAKELKTLSNQKGLYEEYLGPDYHNRIRKMLTLNEEVLPNRIIDAPTNIGGMKQLLSPALERMQIHGKFIDNEVKFQQLSNIALYYLCGILCMAMKSRTSAPPYNLKKYQKNWDKKRMGYMQKGNQLMMGLM